MKTAQMLTIAAALAGLATVAEAQKVHEIRLEADRGKDVYRFVPASVVARPGEVLVFKVTSGAPLSVVFEAQGLSASDRAALNAALPRRAGDLSSPTFPKDGAEYRLVLPNLTPGKYAYFCLPHRAYDMRGEIIIKK